MQVPRHVLQHVPVHVPIQRSLHPPIQLPTQLVHWHSVIMALTHRGWLKAITEPRIGKIILLALLKNSLLDWTSDIFIIQKMILKAVCPIKYRHTAIISYLNNRLDRCLNNFQSMYYYMYLDIHHYNQNIHQNNLPCNLYSYILTQQHWQVKERLLKQ